MKRPLIVGNWKLYVTNRDNAVERAQKVARKSGAVHADIIICPPFPFLESLHKVLSKRKIAVGAQTVSTSGEEKRTGEVTAQMAASVGAQFSIVGHSERRAMGESSEDIQAKIKSIFGAKMSPILCIGEELRDTTSGDHFSQIGDQLRASLPELSPKEASSLIVAYEPIWAIGKSATEAMSPEQLEETVIYIRKILADIVGRAAALRISILYGGSVEPENANALMKSGVSGFLVGHASVDPEALIEIAKQAGGANSSGPVRNSGRARRKRV